MATATRTFTVPLDVDDVYPLVWRWSERLVMVSATEAQREKMSVLLGECTAIERGAVWKLVWREGGQGRVEAMVREIEAGAQISGVAR